MSSRGYIGPSEVKSLIAGWVDLVGRDHDRDHDHDRDRGEYRRDRDRDRDRWQQQPQQQWQQPWQQWQQPWQQQPWQQQPWQQWQQPWQQRLPASAYRHPLHLRRTAWQQPGQSGLLQTAEHVLSPLTSIFGEVPEGAAAPFPPRAALVEHPAPTQADRWILPMSTGVPILPTQSAQITGRPQAQAYQCNRFVISNGGTSGGAADWIVNDIKVGNQSQFVQSGDVPGDMFATNAIDTFVRFQTAQTAMDVVVVVTYIGLNESGVPFFAAMLGTAAV